jgi:endonuclease IV
MSAMNSDPSGPNAVSRGEFSVLPAAGGSRRDRHAHLGARHIGLDAIAAVCAAANAPAVVETADGPAAQASDIAALRAGR